MPLSRRDFLKSVGLAVGGLGLTSGGYTRLIPFLNQPEDIIPGVSTWYATSCRECPAGCAMVVRNREEHVVKCEGNPLHPISQGTLCARGQAALMGLYDPDRIKGPLHKDHSGKQVEISWDDALKGVGSVLTGRPRIAFLTDLQTGSLDALMRAWLGAFGSTRMVVWEPIDYFAVKSVYGGVVPSFNIAGADYIVSFGADFLENWVSPIEFAHGFAIMRKPTSAGRAGFAYIGHRTSATAASADIRILVPPGGEVDVARAIRSGGATADAVASKYHLDPNDLGRIATGLTRARAPLILPGWYPSSAAAATILGAGTSPLANTARPHTVTNIAGSAEMTALMRDMDGGAIDVLVIYGVNPVFSLPDSGRFRDALKKVKTVVSLSPFMNETTVHADWVLPSNTPLESWGDYMPYPDVGNLMQPTMGSVFNTRQVGDILIQLASAAGAGTAAFGATNYYGYLRRRWGAPLAAGASPDTPAPAWEALLRRGGQWPGAETGSATPRTGYETRAQAGMVFGAGVAPVPTAAIPPSPAAPRPAAPAPRPSRPPKSGEIRLFAFPHPYYYDGRNANRRWLQEIPEPVTKAVWGTWAEMHPSTAERLGVRLDHLIEIEYRGRKIQVPAYIWEGCAPDTVAVPIGEGHTDYGRYATDIGVNVYPLLLTPTPTVKVRDTGEHKWATRIKGSTNQWGRDIVQTVDLGRHWERTKPLRMPLPSGYKFWDFYPGHPHKGHRWAMIVDLDRCIGCHACVTACYAENNLGVVGIDGIYRRREMSWIRIDRYMDWHHRSAPVLFQPMLCQHCDAAPCEPVCPVFAAAHSDEGINMQVYNRCVGTRYCSNNCPYKVRRFNWLDWRWPEPLNWQLNPEVTVRRRGVMEKCTFCIQRIREAEITATREKRKLVDGDITPACVQTCPTGVFTFGDLKDPNSRVAKLIRTDPRAYQVLADLNTKPAVIYFKKIVAT